MARFSVTGARSSNKAAIDRIRRSLDGLSEASLDRSIRRALAGARRRFEPAAKRVIRQSYNVPAGDLAGKFSVRSGADDDGEFIALEASRRGIPLLRFGGRWSGLKSPGATAQVQRGERKVYKSAFIATIRGSRVVLARQFMGDGSGKRYPRNELRHLKGPSPSQMVDGADGTNATTISTEVNAFIAKELERQLALARRGS